MSSRRNLAALLALVLFGTSACDTATVATVSPEGSPVEASPDAIEQSASETLLAEPPPTFELAYQFNNVSTRLTEYVPPGETISEWRTKVFFESHADLLESDPLEVLGAEVMRLEEHCQYLRHYNLFSGFENDYPTSVRMIMCGKHALTEEGEVSLVKAIQGNQYLYLIRVVKRLEPFQLDDTPLDPAEVGVWSTYLSRISVCDRDDPAHPCPEG